MQTQDGAPWSDPVSLDAVKVDPYRLLSYGHVSLPSSFCVA